MDDHSHGHLDASLAVLAQIGMRETGAEGFVYFRRTETGGFARSMGSGVYIREESLSGHGSQMTVSFPLRLHGFVDGILAFAFADQNRFAMSRSHLKPLAATIEKVWAAESIRQSYHRLLESIVALETEILDSKIVSRAHGVLNHEQDRDGVDAIIRHVESVLRSTPTMTLLTRLLGELQEEAEERDWAGRAKSILQLRHGMSEEEAHSYLRKSSRQARKRFIDVARQVVEGGR